ncbi:YdcH family protein [Pseudomonas sp. NPDC088444]|uniref:YdcH family protein n=1 Tax=Pseudomonas sp. NPDC088444 TaxID=3364456 RepID=UPI0038517B11
MPVKHDLYADLSITRDELVRLRSQDAKLNQLVDRYDALDADIVKAEAGSAGDVSEDQLKRLKEKRLLAKDEIVRHLPNSV